MKLQLNRILSRIIVVIYLFFTLLFRFIVEEQLLGNILLSVAIGAFFLLFLWALIKVKLLNPKWFWFEEMEEA